MNFDDTPEEAAFRIEVREWLDQHAEHVQNANRRSRGASREEVEEARKWQAKKFAAGFADIRLPRAFGGREGTAIQALIYNQEERNYHVPNGVYGIGLGLVLPTVMREGSDTHRERHVERAFRGEDIWCQLFSEPSAGSDLAALRTKAARDGDDWIINGQKVWTSGAHFADFGIVLVRTDPEAPKHKGLTMFIVDMHAPGVEVRPIKQLSGESDFNEVFFTDVRISDSDRLGAVDDGWSVAMGTLMTERAAAANGHGYYGALDVLRLAADVEMHGLPASENASVRERVADWWINEQGMRLLAARAQTALSKGELPGPEQSVNKAIEVPQAQEVSYYAMEMLGRAGTLAAAELGDDWIGVEHTWGWTPGLRLGGGTDEVLRNIIAERVLGLPGDLRSDKNVPFSQLKN